MGNDPILRAASLIKEARKIVLISGAGLSLDSGSGLGHSLLDMIMRYSKTTVEDMLGTFTLSH